MVRTKADRVPNKAVGSKAPQKNLKSTPVTKSGGSSKGKNYSGGNPYHPRDTPEWQKPITCFLNQHSGEDTSITRTSVTVENEEQNVNEEAENSKESTTHDNHSSDKSD